MGRDATHATTRTPPTRAEVEPRVDVLLEALPYIRQFAGATIVIKYGGAAMTAPDLKASFARDVALLKLVGMNPVVVHGGGPDISRYSDRLGLEVRFVQGLRVTDAPTMELVKMVLVGKINKEIVAQLHVAGVSAVGLAGDDGGLIQAEKASSPDADLGFVGRVAHIDTRVLERLSDFVPVVASVGVDADGQSYNINADTVAGRLAAALGARRAIFLTDVEGIFRDVDDPASLVSECRLADIREMAASGAAGAGMLPKLAAIADALESGVEAVQVIDGRVPHSVLVEIFTEAGIGTKITA
jgi:acetylglutamate kinase